MGEGKKRRIPGLDFAGGFPLSILKIKDFLEFGDGFEKLGLEAIEKGDDFFGRGRRGIEWGR
jgi:hypothetical protein